MNKDSKNKSSEQQSAPVNEAVISLYASHNKIYPRSTFGFFTKWRWAMIWITQIVFYGLPWLEWGHRQALLFDLGARRFYILNLVLYPQDLIYLTAILIISALSLFLFTTIAGRLWCGYTCPQTVYSEIFMWVEHKVEGERGARIKLDSSGMSANKLTKKGLKHLIWILISLWTGFSFVGYFTPIRELAHSILNFNLGSWEIFWLCFYSFATYGNAGFMREQVCKYMCPYARFQSAMFDDNTLIVTYDEARGEPRGARSRKDDAKSKELGSCIDCGLCVQVCPTGIDIRKGLQYECIGCGACADVCDTVMDKIGYPRGLVKYSTQNAMNNKWSKKQMLHHILRPRVIIYSTILGLIVTGFLTSLWLRTPFRLDVVRDRGVMSRLTSDGKLENVYRLQIMNGTEEVQHYQVSVSGLNGLEVEADDSNKVNDDKKYNGTILVAPAEARWITVDLRIPDGTVQPGAHKIMFKIESVESRQSADEKSIFLVPRV